MKTITSTFLSIILLLSSVLAQTGIPPKPNPPRLVNDLADIFSEQEEIRLEQKLINYSDSTGTQIVVLTVTDLNGMDRGEFTYTVLEEWGVGQKGLNNGVVVMIKPTGGQNQRATFIATGAGLEGIIPDITAKQIIENEMIPAFREGKFYEGVNNATDIIMGLAAKEFTAAEYESKPQLHPAVQFVPLLFFIFLFLIINIARRRNSSIGHHTSLWTLLMLLGSGSSRHSGSFGNFSSGRGGFGGFGGGRSGGGGAGGSW